MWVIKCFVKLWGSEFHLDQSITSQTIATDVPISITLFPSLQVKMHVNLMLAKIKLDITISKTPLKLHSSGHYIWAQTEMATTWAWKMFRKLRVFACRVIATDMLTFAKVMLETNWNHGASCMKPLCSGTHVLSLSATSKHILYQVMIKVVSIFFRENERERLFFTFHALLLPSRTIHFISMSNWTDLNY